jgi:integrase/recombinase XerD
MKYVYESTLAEEMNSYLQLLYNNGKYIYQVQSSLRSLDKYLVTTNYTDKSLPADSISSWLKNRDVSARTKIKNLSHMRGFTKYLSSLKIDANYPESYKYQTDYIPYLFTDVEIKRIIEAADNFKARKRFSQSILIFPILLRILLGCGLRLGEGLTLHWKDIDLENGILVIRTSKNLKQRFVPMDNTLTNVLRIYKEMTRVDNICNDYLFESNFQPGTPFKNNTFYTWFIRVLQTVDISYVKQNNRKRGPCPHCLRHYFTFKSFLKSEREGRKFDDTAPFLAAYLGHDSIKETEAYLSSNYTVYINSHKRVDAELGCLFPEVNFNEK